MFSRRLIIKMNERFTEPVALVEHYSTVVDCAQIASVSRATNPNLAHIIPLGPEIGFFRPHMERDLEGDGYRVVQALDDRGRLNIEGVVGEYEASLCVDQPRIPGQQSTPARVQVYTPYQATE